ncbi:hypothetical protein KSS87_003925 [Heliosperma pusillum]|nr:hypothetical protein KSS87_003925 [Heliosperma pusillum]
MDYTTPLSTTTELRVYHRRIPLMDIKLKDPPSCCFQC